MNSMYILFIWMAVFFPTFCLSLVGYIMIDGYYDIKNYSYCNGTLQVSDIQIHRNYASFDTWCHFKPNESPRLVTIRHPFFCDIQVTNYDKNKKWIEETILKRDFYVDHYATIGYDKKPKIKFVYYGIICLIVVGFLQSFFYIFLYYYKLKGGRSIYDILE
jgi:hypothetical protein